MKRVLPVFFMACYGIGCLTKALSSIFRDRLSDFERGFFDGFSIVMIVAGTVLIIWSLVKKQNPFKFEKKDDR